MNEPIINDVVVTLAGSQLAQVTLVILVVALISRVFLRNRPQFAYALWLLALAKCLTPPLWSSSTGLFSWAQLQWQNQTIVAASNGLEVVATPRMLPEPHVWNLSRVLIAIWLIGAMHMIVGIAIRFWMIRLKLLRCSARPPAEVAGAIESLRGTLGIRRNVRAVVCDEPVGPALFGVFSPIVVIPRSILHANTLTQLRPMLAHELMHLRRHDPLVAGLQMLCQAIWWFHPLTWWMNRRINRVRELCCDSEVIAALRCEPGDYAQMLIDVMQLRGILRSIIPSLGVRPVQVTSQRLKHIMNNANQFGRRTRWTTWLIGAAGALILLPGAGMSLSGPMNAIAQEVPSTQPASEVLMPPVTILPPGTETTADRETLQALQFGTTQPSAKAPSATLPAGKLQSNPAKKNLTPRGVKQNSRPGGFKSNPLIVRPDMPKLFKKKIN